MQLSAPHTGYIVRLKSISCYTTEYLYEIQVLRNRMCLWLWFLSLKLQDDWTIEMDIMNKTRIREIRA